MSDPASRSRSDALPALLAFVLIGALTFLAIYQLQPPAAVPANAPPTEFSSGRAMEHLRVIAQKPHPTGSPENQRVREYILQRLAAIGLEPQVQTTTVVGSNPRRGGPAVAATVSNVVARLKGTANTKAVLLAAHDDSVPSGPGASDDGAGTVTLLETARALHLGPPLRNDVIFLFADAEELGLLGAKAFVDEHPWARDAGVALNFDNRGACGPALMFETSPRNGWLIREFAKAAPHPATSSLMVEAYKRLPNDTDFSVFKRAGLAGLNFAYAGCWPRYHTRGDSVENIDERSLQHHGSYALALARHFGNLTLPHPAERDAVYFSLFRFTLFYSQAWVALLMVLTLLLFIAVTRLGLRTAHLTWRGTLRGLVLWLASSAVACAVPELCWLALRRTRLVSLLPYGVAYNSNLYALGFVALAIAIFAGMYLGFRKLASLADLTVGALLWWLLLTILTSLYVPGASFLFTWPLIFALIELGYAFTLKKPESEAARVRIWTLPAVAGILLLAPVPYLLLMLLSASGLVPMTVAVALLLGLLVPYLEIMTAHKRGLLPGAAALAALALIAGAMVGSGYDAKHPRADSVFYFLDTDTGKAVWASGDEAPDAWTSQFLSGRVVKGNLAEFIPTQAPMLESPAPVAEASPPELATLDDIMMGDSRILRLWVTSPRQPRLAWISLQGTKVLDAKVNGKPVERPDTSATGGNWWLVYVGLPKDGIVLTLEVQALEPLFVRVTDRWDGLPAIPGTVFKPRPDDVMPSPAWAGLDSSVLVSKTFRHFEMPHH